MALVILDGRALSQDREAALRLRSAEIVRVRGRAPRLLILAFADEEGEPPWVRGKQAACRAVGIEVEAVVLPRGVDTTEALARFHDRLRTARADAVFVQFPFPTGLDGDALAEAIPPEADIDLMHPDRVRNYLAGGAAAPPLTVRAILALLDAHGVTLADQPTSVLARGTPFDHMLAEALRRRGARVHMGARDTSDARVAASRIVITGLSESGSVSGTHLPPGAVVVDGGYFNPGGRGDVDVSGGVEHLRALAPVPGGIGPMTVSLLLEAVVERAEGRESEV